MGESSASTDAWGTPYLTVCSCGGFHWEVQTPKISMCIEIPPKRKNGVRCESTVIWSCMAHCARLSSGRYTVATVPQSCCLQRQNFMLWWTCNDRHVNLPDTEKPQGRKTEELDRYQGEQNGFLSTWVSGEWLTRYPSFTAVVLKHFLCERLPNWHVWPWTPIWLKRYFSEILNHSISTSVCIPSWCCVSL